nr:hypothetical protein [Tanacetum cinerariifolium]
ISLSIKSGKAAVLLSMNMHADTGHAVALFYEGPALYYFDPNEGLSRFPGETVQLDLAVEELDETLKKYFEREKDWDFSFASLLVKTS